MEIQADSLEINQNTFKKQLAKMSNVPFEEKGSNGSADKAKLEL